MPCYVNCVMYVRQLSFQQLLIWASYRHFKDRFPEAIQREYRDGIKREETRQGWMDGCCHGDNLRILLINRHKPYLLSETIWSAVTTI